MIREFLIHRKTVANLGVRMMTPGEFVFWSRILVGLSLILCILNSSCNGSLNYNSQPLYVPSPIRQTQHLNAHENTEYRYEFLYHSNYRVQKENSSPPGLSVGFQKANNSLGNSMVWTFARRIPDVSLLEFAISSYTGPHPPGGPTLQKVILPFIPTPNPNVSSRAIVSEQFPFTTPYGLKGYELHIATEITETIGTTVRVYESQRKPLLLFVFDISTSDRRVALFFLGADSKNDIDILRTFANSLRISQDISP